jgi:hypothetical protein
MARTATYLIAHTSQSTGSGDLVRTEPSSGKSSNETVGENQRKCRERLAGHRQVESVRRDRERFHTRSDQARSARQYQSIFRLL